MPSYARAALRHCGDGQDLSDRGRHVSADHLAGLGVECALKALLMGVCGIAVTPQGIVGPFRVHGTVLWAETLAHLHGPAAATYFAPVLLADPFVKWGIEDRYEDGVRHADGSTITPQESAALLAICHDLIAQLQAATTDGLTVGL